MVGFNVKLKESFDEAVVRVVEALKKEGFGVLSDLDIQAAMKEKLGAEIPRPDPGRLQSATGAQGPDR